MENSQPHKPKPSIPHSNKGFMMTIITFECSYSGEAYAVIWACPYAYC
jgi:hypothetical protein